MTIYASNLSFHTSEEDLRTMFSKFGKVDSAKIITDRLTSKSRGFAFIEMPDDDAAHAAIQSLDNKDIEGRALSVTVAKPRENKGFRKNMW